MHDALLRKLQVIADLSAADRASLQGLGGGARQVAAGQSIISEGDNPGRVHLILDDWAIRSKIVSSGKQQITAILLPGDFCDLHVTVLDEMDHSILALTATTVAYIRPEQIEEVTDKSLAIMRAFWWLTLLDEAVLRSWLVNVGRRSAIERIAHLVCELLVRAERIGLAEDDAFMLPLTQEQLGDATGLTSVHVNRSLMRLRSLKLIEWRRGELRLLDRRGLEKLGGFDPSYLHAPLAGRGRR